MTIKRKKETSLKHDQCIGECPAGNPCTLSKWMMHALHICSDSACFCHTKERYESELTRQEYPQGVNP